MPVCRSGGCAITPPPPERSSNAAGSSGSRRPPLRVGLLVDSMVVPRWVSEVIAEAVAACFIEPVLVVVTPRRSARPNRVLLAREALSATLYTAYRFIDARLFRRSEDPFARVDLAPRVAGVRRLELQPQDARDALLREDLDVLLRLAPIADPQTLARTARHGVWSLVHGHGDSYQRDAPLFWDIYDAAPVSGTVLEAITDPSEPPLALYCSYSATDQISLRRNRDPTYWKSARIPVRSLRELHAPRPDRTPVSPTDERGARPVGVGMTGRRRPTNAEMVPYLGRVATRAMRRQLRSRLFYEEWFLAFRERGTGVLPADMRRFRVVEPPRGRSYADPFVVERDGRHDVFFEDYAIDDHKGRISVCELGAAGVGMPRVALETAYHLSYPSVFEWDGKMYMLPETSANRSIELFRAVRYPDAWELARVLMDDVVALDTTLLRHGGRVWLFANMPVRGARANDELSLFWSDSLLGDWTPHPRNPIVSDVRCARPAGEIIQAAGRLIRPAQDGSGAYGSAVVFRQIDVLTTDDYRESTVGRIDAGWLSGNQGTHTYNRDAQYEVVDGRRLYRRSRARERART